MEATTSAVIREHPEQQQWVTLVTTNEGPVYVAEMTLHGTDYLH